MSQPKRQIIFSLNQPASKQEGDRREYLDLLPATDQPLEACMLNEIGDRLQEIIDSPKWQKIHPKNRPDFNLANFLWYKCQGLSYKAIAVQLGVSPAYAASHWQRKFQPILQDLFRDLWEAQ
ncbi:MAG: sigma-70 family RNA polymerase sigma factor [Limnothrix sp. RL_2_0]|nr:sigma-70 family RNA polymerase sigma factor [Limnothrix sp. RL_2_0]